GRARAGRDRARRELAARAARGAGGPDGGVARRVDAPLVGAPVAAAGAAPVVAPGAAPGPGRAWAVRPQPSPPPSPRPYLSARDATHAARLPGRAPRARRGPAASRRLPRHPQHDLLADAPRSGAEPERRVRRRAARPAGRVRRR